MLLLDLYRVILRVERRSALPDAEIPDTATIAAIPMPIPIEVSVALPFLARTPYRATKNKVP